MFLQLLISLKKAKEDERDYIFELKSYKTSNTIFQISIFFLICSITFNPLSNHYEFTPTLIAAFLIIITLFVQQVNLSVYYIYIEEVSKWENKRLKIKFVDFDLDANEMTQEAFS